MSRNRNRSRSRNRSRNRNRNRSRNRGRNRSRNRNRMSRNRNRMSRNRDANTIASTNRTGTGARTRDYARKHRRENTRKASFFRVLETSEIQIQKKTVSEPGFLMSKILKEPPKITSVGQIYMGKTPHPAGISTSIRFTYLKKLHNRILVLIPAGCGVLSM